VHVRFEWICGLTVERYDYRDGRRPPTVSVNIVSGEPAGDRASLCLNNGMGADPLSERILQAIWYALGTSDLAIAPARRRVSDNGKHGVLTWDFHAVNGAGISIPETLIGGD